MADYELHCGDCLDVMATLEAGSVDAIVTDPPYELGFMGKAWDGSGIAYNVDLWRECLRVLKPGGYLLAFGGSRTYHRLACAVEDAGFEIRDQIMWVYGSGFPKSLDVGKAIDKAAGVKREVVGTVRKFPSASSANINDGWRRPWAEDHPNTMSITVPATMDAQKWDGWGTALKPAHEPIVVARKPLAERTVAANVLEWGTGAINVDGCRVGTDETISNHSRRAESAISKGKYGSSTAQETHQTVGQILGRWPANFIHDGSDEVLAGFPVTTQAGSPVRNNKLNPYGNERTWSMSETPAQQETGYADTGSAARFFYCAKASKADRNEGLEGLEKKGKVFNGQSEQPAGNAPGSVEDKFSTQPSANHHPTVKPTDLMRYLCRLITPPGGLILDPFAGSGSTGKAAILEGFRFVGIEQSAEYLEIAQRRIKWAVAQMAAGEFVDKRGQVSDLAGLPMFDNL